MGVGIDVIFNTAIIRHNYKWWHCYLCDIMGEFVRLNVVLHPNLILVKYTTKLVCSENVGAGNFSGLG